MFLNFNVTFFLKVLLLGHIVADKILLLNSQKTNKQEKKNRKKKKNQTNKQTDKKQKDKL